MSNADSTRDDQSGAETFDETHTDDEGAGDLLLDEMGSVPDLTHEPVDDADESPDEDDDGTYELQDRADIASDLSPGGTVPPPGPEEIELVYMGLLDDVRGAQASAAHWEARRLSDADIAALGYGPDEAIGQEPSPAEGKTRS